MEPQEELYMRSRVYEHDARLNQLAFDVHNIKATASTVVHMSPDLIDSRIEQVVNKKMERFVDKVVEVYDLYCSDRSLSTTEFEDKVRGLLLE